MFANIIKDLRNSRKYSMAELGRLVGAAKTTVSSWENAGNYPNTDTLIKLSSLFGVSIDYLLGANQENIQQAKNITNAVNDPVSDTFNKMVEEMRNDGLSDETIERYIDLAKQLAVIKTPPIK